MNDHIGKWERASRLAFSGSVIQAAFNFIGMSLVMYLGYHSTEILINGIMPSVASMSLEDYWEKFAGMIIGACVCFGLALAGYIIYMTGTYLFKGAQTSYKSTIRTRDLMLAELILPGLTVLFLLLYFFYPVIPLMLFDLSFTVTLVFCGLVLLSVIGPIVDIRALSKEETWSETARRGANDLKVSYWCILWILILTVLVAAVISSVFYSSVVELETLGASYGTYGDDAMGVPELVQKTEGMVRTIKMTVMAGCILVLIFLMLNTIYRIIGWNRIRLGGVKASAIRQGVSGRDSYS